MATLSSSDRKRKLSAVQDQFKRQLDLSDQKVALAVQTYELVSIAVIDSAQRAKRAAGPHMSDCVMTRQIIPCHIAEHETISADPRPGRPPHQKFG